MLSLRNSDDRLNLMNTALVIRRIRNWKT